MAIRDRLIGWIGQLRAWLRKDAVERELAEEMRFHVQMEMEKNLREGMNTDEARRTALIAFGGVERFKEGVREARWVRLLDDLGADIRYAARTLINRPGFAAASSTERAP